MAKQTAVQVAYQPVGGGGAAAAGKGSGWGSGCAYLGLFGILALLLASSLSSGGSGAVGANDGTKTDTIVSGQAHHHMEADTTKKSPNHYQYTPGAGVKPTKVESPPLYNPSKNSDLEYKMKKTSQSGNGIQQVSQFSSSSSSSGGLRGKSSGDTEKDMMEVVDVASNDIVKAGQDEVKQNKSMLSTAVASLGSSIYSAVSSLWGSSNKEQVQQITEEITAELEKNVTSELEKDGKDIGQQVITDLDVKVEIEEESGISVDQIEKDVKANEGKALTDVRSRIDKRAKDLQGGLRSRTANIEKELLEKKLSKQLGHNVKLEVVGDSVQYAEQNQPASSGGSSSGGGSGGGGSGGGSGSSGGGVSYQPPPNQYKPKKPPQYNNNDNDP